MLYDSQQVASRKLTQALRAKPDFIADASHEPRTPFTVLRCNSDAGLAIDRNCAHREILEKIVSESARMTKLVEDLLFLARSDADSVPLNIEKVSAEPLFFELSERARALGRERGVTIAPRLDGYGLLSIDTSTIEQAVMILIDNAINYSPAGSMVRITTSSWREEFIVEVADQGPGIRKEGIPLVFERFRRVNKTRRGGQAGTGLGLTIAKTIVNAHQGRIEVHRRVNEGTQMRIYLPLAQTQTTNTCSLTMSCPMELAP